MRKNLKTEKVRILRIKIFTVFIKIIFYKFFAFVRSLKKVKKNFKIPYREMPSAHSFTTYCSNLIILPQHQNLHISPLVDIRLNLKLFLLTSFQEISEIFKDMYVPIDCCSISPLSYQTFFFIVRVCVKFNF